MKLFLFFIFLFPVFAFAQSAVQVDALIAPPEWLASVILFLKSVPYVGPALVVAFKWAGILSGAMTAISLAAISFLRIPELAARWAGAKDLADKIDAVAKKVLPWLKYLSMFNVQKEELKKSEQPKLVDKTS